MALRFQGRSLEHVIAAFLWRSSEETRLASCRPGGSGGQLTSRGTPAGKKTSMTFCSVRRRPLLPPAGKPLEEICTGKPA